MIIHMAYYKSLPHIQIVRRFTMRAFATLLLVVSSAFAYQVTSPGDSQGWTSTGPNSLKWVRVDTDPLNFTAVLTNTNRAVMPLNDQVLNALVDGTLGTIVCNPPSGGWPLGSGFRVNLAQDAQHLDTLLAQSDEFSITTPSASGGSTSSTSAPGSIQTSAPAVTPTTSTPSGVSSSDTSTTPTGTNAAILGADSQTGLLTAVAALTAFITALF
ncbi:hypothetical protein BS17DRAFT_494256 [Gyrodon lividus]|nr:hypothetical protein BS17DRAFT_494256 [Gyrodon lividus]